MTASVVRIASAAGSIVLALAFPVVAKAQDPSIDKLLNKLPPPEKLVKARVDKELRKNDPALKDPATGRIFSLVEAGDFSGALNSSRQLVTRYPKSPFAHFLHGAVALDTRQYPEASGAFRNAMTLEPSAAIAHLAFGASEMMQNHYAAALPQLEQTEKLEPSWGTGWMLASVCAEHLGRREESLTLARRATAAEPSWVYTWIQLARAEKAVGHPQETLNAISHAAITRTCSRWLVSVTST
jgi:predicted Zn-dependent protease